MRSQNIVALVYVFLAMYAVLLCLILRNVLRYVIGMKKYREFRITWFYILAVAVVSLRVTDNILILVRNHLHGEDHYAFDYHMWMISYTCR